METLFAASLIYARLPFVKGPLHTRQDMRYKLSRGCETEGQGTHWWSGACPAAAAPPEEVPEGPEGGFNALPVGVGAAAACGLGLPGCSPPGGPAAGESLGETCLPKLAT